MRSLTIALLLSLSATALLAQERTFAPPRTPWGDPDIQGDYTNKYEQGTPFERPASSTAGGSRTSPATSWPRWSRERAAEAAPQCAVHRWRSDRRQLRRRAGVLRPLRGRPRQPALVRRRSAGRQGAADDAEGAARPRRARPPEPRCGAAAGRPIPTPIAASTTAASRAACRLDDADQLRQLLPHHPGAGLRGHHATRWSTRRGSSRSTAGRHSAPSIRQYMGEPRGHWDGNTLVVETTQLQGRARLSRRQPGDAEADRALHADRTRHARVVGHRRRPGTWTRPWTFAMPLTRNDKEAVLEYACHEGNLAMANVLSAARAEGADIRVASRRPAPGPPIPARAPRSAESRSTGCGPRFPLTGAWRTDRARPNFAGYSTATRLLITESADRVVVETNTGTEGQMQVAIYSLDGAEVGVPGPVGWNTTARASRQDGKLAVAITRTIDGPTAG